MDTTVIWQLGGGGGSGIQRRGTFYLYLLTGTAETAVTRRRLRLATAALAAGAVPSAWTVAGGRLKTRISSISLARDVVRDGRGTVLTSRELWPALRARTHRREKREDELDV